ncbi:hypothetical protein [Pontibaca salina]|uniref:Uncharacterized protein n=1 Tax=Pontibaca salina TaxID=2795731 RepID=A0A934HUA7_9RHOB|nr:hypothetical protein [Pontibaca salina]MBI6630368.1 hypothetical protein [Pontibaca salina]
MPDGQVMTRVPALPSAEDSADTQIDAAILRLVDLLARQTAREIAADAPVTKESFDAPPSQKSD